MLPSSLRVFLGQAMSSREVAGFGVLTEVEKAERALGGGLVMASCRR